MEELTLEKEFEFYKLSSMYDVLFVRMVQYYRDLQSTGITLPEFMVEAPDVLAKREMNNILANNDRTHFYNLYEKAYQELATQGEF